MRAFRVSDSIWLTHLLFNLIRNAMRNARTLFALLLLSSLFFSCTKQDITEDENLIEDTEVFATDGEDSPPPPPPTKGDND